MRRRGMLMAAVMVLALLVAAGTALAATIDGTRGDDRIRGTNGPDQIDGRAGDDVLRGARGADTIDGGPGDDFIVAGPRMEVALDTVDAGPGNDVIRTHNDPAARDVVDCGRGFDRIVADSRDLVTRCERVRRL